MNKTNIEDTIYFENDPIMDKLTRELIRKDRLERVVLLWNNGLHDIPVITKAVRLPEQEVIDTIREKAEDPSDLDAYLQHIKKTN